jgi:hypothetical protein
VTPAPHEEYDDALRRAPHLCRPLASATGDVRSAVECLKGCVCDANRSVFEELAVSGGSALAATAVASSYLALTEIPVVRRAYHLLSALPDNRGQRSQRGWAQLHAKWGLVLGGSHPLGLRLADLGVVWHVDSQNTA